MLIERVIIGNSGNYHTWIDFGEDKPLLVFCFDNKKRADYYIESLFLTVLREEEFFIVSDGFDGKGDIFIPLKEIKIICKNILSALPGIIGKIETTVSFVPCDPFVPF